MKIYNVTFRDIRNIASWTIEELQDEIEKIRSEKKRLSAEQKYDFVMLLRDREKELDLKLKTKNMGIKSKRYFSSDFDKNEIEEFVTEVFEKFEDELKLVKKNLYTFQITSSLIISVFTARTHRAKLINFSHFRLSMIYKLYYTTINGLMKIRQQFLN